MDTAYYSNEDPGTGGDPNASSDSSGIGGGGPGDSSSADFRAGIGLGSGGDFNAPGDITGMGFGGVGQGPGGAPGGFGGNYYRSGGGGGGGGYYRGGGGGYGRYGGYGGAGGFGGLGFGSDLGSLAQNAGFGFGPSAGNPAGYGPPPSVAGSGPDSTPVQSAAALTNPGNLTYGADDPNAAQPSAPGGTQSGPSIMDQFLSTLGGIVNPISAANAAEAPPTAGPQPGQISREAYDRSMLSPANEAAMDRSMILQNIGERGTLTPQDISLSANTASNTGLAGNDPLAGTEAAPMGGAPPPAATGTGWFSTAGNPAGGEAAPMGGAQPPANAGWFTADNAAGGEGAPEGGATPFGQEFGPFQGSGGPGSITSSGGLNYANVPGTGTPIDRVAASDLADLASRAGATNVPGDITGLGYQGPTAAQQIAARYPSQGDTAVVPPTDTAANLALQGVDSPPPGGPLTGGTGGGPLEPDALGAPPGRFGPNDSGFRLAGTTADTATPPVEGSPADIAAQPSEWTQAFTGNPPPGSFQIPTNATPFAGNNRFAAGDQPNRISTADMIEQAARNLPRGQSGSLSDTDPATLNQRFSGGIPQPYEPTPYTPEPPSPRGPSEAPFTMPPASAPSAPGTRTSFTQEAGGAPQASGRGAPSSGAGGSAPAGGAGGAGTPAGGGAGDYPDQRGGFERGRRRTIGQQIFGPGGAISSLFGGNSPDPRARQLGDTVASLMAQLGIPAALIFAATRGGGVRLPMVGGARAMSGAGQVGGFSPQFSRQLFPGPGIPALVGLGLGGAALGQSLVNPPQQDQGGGSNTPPASPPPSQIPPTLRSPSTTDLAARPAELAGGATEGATRARPAPFGAANAPQGTMAGATNAPGMLNPITQPGGVTQAENFIMQHGGHTAGTGAPNLNPEFASRVQRAAMAYTAETGRQPIFDEMGRSKEQQAIYYARFLHGGPRAAPPETGRHVKGLAIDIPDGDFQRWMHRNAWKFGLQDLAPSLNDPNHFQMANPVLAGIRQRQAMAQ